MILRANRKAVVQFCVAAGFSGGFLLAHGPFVNKLKNYRMTKSALNFMSTPSEAGMISDKTEISPYLRKLIDEVLDDMDAIDDHWKKKVEFMTTSSTKSWSVGSIFLSKAIVAIPDYFNIQSSTELRANSLNELLKRDFEWEVPKEMWFTGMGKLLISSFLMSDAAKKYLIAREIGSVAGREVFYHATLIFLTIYTFYLISYLYERAEKIKLSHLPKKQQLLIVSLGALISAFMYYGIKLVAIDNGRQQNGEAFALTRGLKNSSDLRDDVDRDDPRMLCPEYYEAALEYHHKCIDRHSALHYLTRETEPFYRFKAAEFTALGDHKSGLFSPDLTTNTRLNIIRRWLQGRREKRNYILESIGEVAPPSFEPDPIEEKMKKKLKDVVILK